MKVMEALEELELDMIDSKYGFLILLKEPTAKYLVNNLKFGFTYKILKDHKK